MRLGGAREAGLAAVPVVMPAGLPTSRRANEYKMHTTLGHMCKKRGGDTVSKMKCGMRVSRSRKDVARLLRPQCFDSRPPTAADLDLIIINYQTGRHDVLCCTVIERY